MGDGSASVEEHAGGAATEEAKELEAVPDDHVGYASLEGTTISKKIGEHEYKLTFFKNAKQGTNSLGRWDKWDGLYDASFTGGTKCWEGPARELKVKFQCGVEAELEDVWEPSKCVYAATVFHPGACDFAEFERLTVGGQVLGPREEL